MEKKIADNSLDGNAMFKSKHGKNFKGVWIPRVYIEDVNLNNQERILLSVILALSNNNTNVCTARNSYFGLILGITTRRVQQILSGLKQKKYLHIRILFHEGEKNLSYREVKISSFHSCNNLHPNIKEDTNSLIINNTEMSKIFNSWINYRKEIGKPLVKSSLEASYKKLLDLSKDDSILAKKIIDQTIENGWQSLQPLYANGDASGIREGVILNNTTENFKEYDF